MEQVCGPEAQPERSLRAKRQELAEKRGDQYDFLARGSWANDLSVHGNASSQESFLVTGCFDTSGDDEPVPNGAQWRQWRQWRCDRT